MIYSFYGGLPTPISQGFPREGFASYGSPNRNFNNIIPGPSFGGLGATGSLGLYGAGVGLGGFGGGAAFGWAAFAASITNLVFTIASLRQDHNNNNGGGHECGSCNNHQFASHHESGHPDISNGHYIDGASQHRWDGDGYNMGFDLDYGTV